MQRIVINKCYGGFGLSREAVARLAELQGRACYFFTHGRTAEGIDLYTYAPLTNDEDASMWFAFDIPNPNEMLRQRLWSEMTNEERQADNTLYGTEAEALESHRLMVEKHHLDERPSDRADPLLLRVVDELGRKADGFCAELAIVEVPDGVEWQIEEYDGREWVAEKHRTWS